jgi:hypothetical protein
MGKKSEVVLTKKVRQLPHRPGEVPTGKEERAWSNALPKGSAGALPMGKEIRELGSPHEGSANASPTWRGANEEDKKSPEQRSSQGLGQCLADGECEEIQGGVDPRGSAIALPMGFPGARPLPRRWGKKEASRVSLIPKARPLPYRWE